MKHNPNNNSSSNASKAQSALSQCNQIVALKLATRVRKAGKRRIADFVNLPIIRKLAILNILLQNPEY